MRLTQSNQYGLVNIVKYKLALLITRNT